MELHHVDIDIRAPFAVVYALQTHTQKMFLGCSVLISLLEFHRQLRSPAEVGDGPSANILEGVPELGERIRRPGEGRERVACCHKTTTDKPISGRGLTCGGAVDIYHKQIHNITQDIYLVPQLAATPYWRWDTIHHDLHRAIQ